MSASNPDPGWSILLIERLTMDDITRVQRSAKSIPRANRPADWFPSKPPAESGMFLGSETKNQTKAPTVTANPKRKASALGLM